MSNNKHQLKTKWSNLIYQKIIQFNHKIQLNNIIHPINYRFNKALHFKQLKKQTKHQLERFIETLDFSKDILQLVQDNNDKKRQVENFIFKGKLWIYSHKKFKSQKNDYIVLVICQHFYSCIQFLLHKKFSLL